MNGTNIKIRQALRYHSVPVWKLADAYGKSENTMYRIFRHELPASEQERIIQMIEKIAKERSD
ncbi:MAG: hypothetical protein IKG34_10130 [Solobacterium sp.]|nr:hypothetical protein [Solobacterium sp.]